MTESSKRCIAVINETSIDAINGLCRAHKLTQAEVVQTLLTVVDGINLTNHLIEKRQAKLAARGGKSAVLKRLAKLTTEELAHLEKSL